MLWASALFGLGPNARLGRRCARKTTGRHRTDSRLLIRSGVFSGFFPDAQALTAPAYLLRPESHKAHSSHRPPRLCSSDSFPEFVNFLFSAPLYSIIQSIITDSVGAIRTTQLQISISNHLASSRQLLQKHGSYTRYQALQPQGRNGNEALAIPFLIYPGRNISEL